MNATADTATRKRSAQPSAFRTVEDVAKILGIDPWSDEPGYSSETWTLVYREAIKEGASEDEADERAQAAEWAEQADAYRQWRNALESTADQVFRDYCLMLDWSKVDKTGRVKVEPVTTWTDAASAILGTINGVGMFEFSSTREFLESGLYTARQAVLSHLGWIKDRSNVYGTPSPQRMMDRALR